MGQTYGHSDGLNSEGGEWRVWGGVDRRTDRRTNGWMLRKGTEGRIGADGQMDRHKERGRSLGWGGWVDRQMDRRMDAMEGNRGLGWEGQKDRWTDGCYGRGQRVWVGTDGQTDGCEGRG